MDNEMIFCNIDPNKMWLSIAIRRPEGEEDLCLSRQLLVQYIKDKGVTAGIDMYAIDALCECVEYEKDIIVVSGKPAVNGVDGHFEYTVNLEDKKSKPVVAEDGTVDYLNSLEIAMVEAGDEFATYIPPTKGEYGYNIYSEVLKPIPGKPAKVLRGKGFKISDDNITYTASVSGRIYKDGERIIIEPIYVVKGDLGVTHGNVKFNGDVEVMGDMHSGTTIEAAGSVFIHGHIGNCVIKAGENITIGKGVQGKYGGELIAGGVIAGNYMEHCNIKCNGNVYANSLLDCYVVCKDSVIVTTKKGCIIGGDVRAMKMIRANGVGNVFGVKTKLFFGELPEYRQQLLQYRERLKQVEINIDTCDKAALKLSEIPPEHRTPAIQEHKRRIAQQKITNQTERKELEAKIIEYEDDIYEASINSTVQITGVVFPGTIVRTETATVEQMEAYRDVCYRIRFKDIMVMPLSDYLEIEENSRKEK